MAEEELRAAAAVQPWLPSLRRAVRRSRRLGEESVALTLTLRVAVASRIIIWAVGLATLIMFGRNGYALPFNDPNHLTEPFAQVWANFLVEPGARWDSVWYLGIAHSGYFAKPATAFFPLYPLLIHLGTFVLGSALLAGLVISVCSLVVALYLLYLLARLDLGESGARTTLLLLAFFPTSFFFSAVYTEALFLALSVGAIYAARRDRWAIASLLACLAAASRSNGLLVIVPLAWIYLYGPRDAEPRGATGSWWRPRYPLSRSALWLLLVPAGVVAYLGYLWITHNAPLAPFQVQSAWQRQFAGPFGAIVHLATALPHDVHQFLSGHTLEIEPGDPLSWTTHSLIDVPFLIFALAGLAWSWRRVPRAYFVYALVMLAQVLSYPTPMEPLVSFSRYILVIFPLFMGWGGKLADKPLARRFTLVISAGLLAAFSGLWAYWGFVA